MLGLRLREARRQAALTQAQLATAAGLDVTTIRLIETGKGRLVSFHRVLATLGLEIRSRQLQRGLVGAALRVLRTRRKLSQRAAAKALDVSRNTLAALEANGPGRVETLARYAEFLGVELALAGVGTTASFHTGTAASSVHHGWETPRELAEQLHAAVGEFDLDPCVASRDRRSSAIKARVRLSPDDDNGLHAAWRGLVFVNLPHGRATRQRLNPSCQGRKD